MSMKGILLILGVPWCIRELFGLFALSKVFTLKPPLFSGSEREKIASIFLSRNRGSEFAPFASFDKVYSFAVHSEGRWASWVSGLTIVALLQLSQLVTHWHRNFNIRHQQQLENRTRRDRLRFSFWGYLFRRHEKTVNFDNPVLDDLRYLGDILPIKV